MLLVMVALMGSVLWAANQSRERADCYHHAGAVEDCPRAWSFRERLITRIAR